MHHAWLWTACLVLAPVVQAGSWFRVTEPGSPRFPVVEVDLASIHVPLGQVEALLRVTHARPQRHPMGFRYRSFEAVVRYRCSQGELRPLAVTYFSGPNGAGGEVGAETDLRREGVRANLMAALPAHTRASLLRAGCAMN